MIKQQFPDVGGIYGAPMGRDTFGRTEDCEPETISIFKVRLDSGGYDDGGAYWGIPNNLYYASDNDDRYAQFVRAYSPREAALQLEIEPECLVPQDYAEEARELLATSLLEEEVYSAMEDVSPEDFPDVSPDDLLERQNEIAQGDLSDYLQIENHLPWDKTDQAIAEINLKWQGRYSVAQLYAEWGSKAIANLAITLSGGGCSPSDDPDIHAQFIELGINDYDFCQVYLEAWDAVDAIVEQRKASS